MVGFMAFTKKIFSLGLMLLSVLSLSCILDENYPNTPTTPTPTVSSTATPTPSATNTATPKPSTTPTSTPTATPTATPVPTVTPSVSITPDWVEVFFSKIPSDPTQEVNLDENIDKKLIQKLNNATKSIDMAVFELDSVTIADALINAKKRGVTVRIVTDTDYINEVATQKVKTEGIGVVDDNRSALMHNKFIVIDNEYVWTGSFNATENDAYKNNNNSVDIKSKELAQNYATEFNEMFVDKKFGVTSPNLIPNPLIKMSDNTELISLFSPENNPDQFIVDEIKKATKKISFMAFSFTHDEIGQAMIDKFNQGVEVKGIFEAVGANTTYSEYPKMKALGIDVRLDANKNNLHHKVIIIDGKVTMLGSFNFSANATQSNDENLLTIRNNEFVAKNYTDEFNKLFALTTTN